MSRVLRGQWVLLSRVAASVLLMYLAVVSLPHEAVASGGVLEATIASYPTTSGTRLYVLGLRNVSALSLESVRVDWMSSANDLSHEDLGAFASGQARVCKFTSAVNRDRLHVEVSYTKEGVPARLDIGLEPTSGDASSDTRDTWRAVGLALGPALVSLLNVVLGAILLHSFTAKREIAREKAERARTVCQIEYSAYVEFLSDWGGNQSLKILDNSFTELRRKVLVPEEVVAAVARFREVAAEGHTVEERNKAETAVRDAVRRTAGSSVGRAKRKG